jgi:hypothetical protein
MRDAMVGQQISTARSASQQVNHGLLRSFSLARSILNGTEVVVPAMLALEITTWKERHTIPSCIMVGTAVAISVRWDSFFGCQVYHLHHPRLAPIGNQTIPGFSIKRPTMIGALKLPEAVIRSATERLPCADNIQQPHFRLN